MAIIDVAFPLRGGVVPKDHGYALYAAVCKQSPDLHQAEWLGIHPIGGTVLGEALVLRSPRGDGGAQLRFRIPSERIVDLLSLAGRALNVAGTRLLLGAPTVFALHAASSVDARLVLIRLTRPPLGENELLRRKTLDVDGFAARYRQELARQLAALGIEGQVSLMGRRSLSVAGKRVVGYSVRVAGLEDESSLRLQQAGLGGKRRMGCGLFRPTRVARSRG